MIRRSFWIITVLTMSFPSSRTFSMSYTRLSSLSRSFRSSSILQYSEQKQEIKKRDDDTVSVAPMMEYTDRHFRYLIRLISNRSKLYTEMVTANTLVHNDNIDRWLRFNQYEQPLVLQFGSSNVKDLSIATQRAMQYGYQEFNLNCGCPSEKVAGNGCFGAALMINPSLISDLCQSIHETAIKKTTDDLHSNYPVTVKCRIGTLDKKDMRTKLDVNDEEDYVNLSQFIETVSKPGVVKHFIVHARKAVLGGLSTTKNREIPPLKYHMIHRLCKDFPDLKFTINGGVQSIEEGEVHLKEGVGGMMLGRAVIGAPWKTLAHVDQYVFNEPPSTLTRRKLLVQYSKYCEEEMALALIEQPHYVKSLRRLLMRPIAYLFAGEKNAKFFRRTIEENLKKETKGLSQVIEASVSIMPDEVLDALPRLPSDSALAECEKYNPNNYGGSKLIL